MSAETTPKPFRYALQPLLRKRSADLDRAREALAAAVSLLDTRKRELEAHAARIGQLQSRQRELSQSGVAIDVAARLRLYECIQAAVAQRQERAAQLDQARVHHDGATDQVRLARQALKALERHREQAAQKHRADQIHRVLDFRDELQLSSGRSAARLTAAGGQTGSET